MGQKELLEFTYQVNGRQGKQPRYGLARSTSDSKIPSLPQLSSMHGRQVVTGGDQTSSYVKLPMLPDASASTAQVLAIAAAAASEAAMIAARGMNRSKSESSMKRKKSRTRLFKLLNITEPTSPTADSEDLRRQWEWECQNLPSAKKPEQAAALGGTLLSGVSPPRPPKPQLQAPGQSPSKALPSVVSGKRAPNEVTAHHQITSAARRVCSELLAEAPAEGSATSPKASKASSKMTALSSAHSQADKSRKTSKESKKEKADAEAEAWRRATLAAVPEAHAAEKSAAVERQRQAALHQESEVDALKDEPPQKCALGEEVRVPSQSGSRGSSRKSSKRSVNSAVLLHEGLREVVATKAAAGEPRRRSVRVPTLTYVQTTAVPEEAEYGLPDLAKRLEMVQNVYIKGKEFGSDEVSQKQLRAVFNHFRAGGDMAKADLPEIMKYLGFAVASVDELKKISGKVNLLPDVDFNEFMAFVERFSQHEYDRYRKIFDEYDSEGTGDVVKTTELRKILSSIGFNVMRPAIEEALATFDIATADVTMSYEDFIQFLTVYMHTECFAKHQVMNMYNIFNGFTAHAADPRYLPATDLSECLVAAFGLPCQQHAVRIEQLVLRFRKSRSDGENGICFHEFMIFGRRLCEAEQADYRGAFVQFDKDNSGSISIDELSAALDCLGYRPMRSMLQEVLSEVDFESDEILDFEEFSHFMMLFKQRDGFLKKELDELKAVFCKFDCDRSDSIDVHELGDMLRFLGHSIATDDLHILVAEVDADRSGTLDVNEWLRLMRRHRESELKRLSDIFMHHAQGQAMMPSASITVAVQEAAPDPTLVPKVTRTLHKAIDFEDFVNLADRARALHVDAGRKMAGFSDIEIENFQEMFDGYDKDGNGTIDSVEVQALLGDFGIPCRTREEQQNMLELIATAKALCLEAEGRKSGETPKKGGPVPAIDVTFWELVQFVRLLKTQRAKEEEATDTRLIAKLKFSQNEIDDFRVIFKTAARNAGAALEGQEKVSGSGRRISLLGGSASRRQGVEEQVSSLSSSQLQKLLKSLGLTLSVKNKETLEEHLASLAEKNDKGHLVFVGFLQMMRWFLDDNFAGINNVAKKEAEAAAQ